MSRMRAPRFGERLEWSGSDASSKWGKANTRVRQEAARCGLEPARDFMWQQLVRNSVSGGFNRMRMADQGLTPDQIQDVLRGADLQMVFSGAARASQVSPALGSSAEIVARSGR